MGAVTDEVLRQAVAQAADWRRHGLDLRISVNLSASNLLDTDVPRRVATRAEAIVASTVDLAHRLGLRVVAEGVEHAATLARLADLGCDESQGYLHAPALPADRLEEGLAGRGRQRR